MRGPKIIGFFANYPVLYIILSILVAEGLYILFRSGIRGPVLNDDIGNGFVPNFIEWFGVLYGLLLPLVMVRVWEQLDDIDREFDREADAIKILYEDLSYLQGESVKVGIKIAKLLRKYVRHVIRNYKYEVKEFELVRLAGDNILECIRDQFFVLIHPDVMNSKVSEFLVPEIFERFNEIIDIRGDRISLASQRLFDTLRNIALIASIVFILPFYILVFSIPMDILDYILVIGVTLLVVFIYQIVEDFDEPFGGTWKISSDSWVRLRISMLCKERNRRAVTRNDQRRQRNGEGSE
jgi:hypothetical protein